MVTPNCNKLLNEPRTVIHEKKNITVMLESHLIEQTNVPVLFIIFLELLLLELLLYYFKLYQWGNRCPVIFQIKFLIIVEIQVIWLHYSFIYENDQQQNHRHRISVDLKDFHTSTDDVHKAIFFFHIYYFPPNFRFKSCTPYL